MTKKVLPIIRFVARAIGFLIPWQLGRYGQYFVHHAYSAIQAKSFKSCGKSFYIETPAVLRGTKYVTIGDNFICNKRLRVETFDRYKGQEFSPQIIIGDNVGINYNCHIGCINKITIGNNVLIGSNVLIIDHSHGEIGKDALLLIPADRPLVSKGEVTIEDNVWIGEGVAILPGVTIGKNSIIGANAVVSRSVPAHSVVVGNPAKVIKNLNGHG